MRCDMCDNGERQTGLRTRVAERDGRTAVVLGVPVEECPSCGEVWFSMETAIRLDEIFEDLLSTGADSSKVHWNSVVAA